MEVYAWVNAVFIQWGMLPWDNSWITAPTVWVICLGGYNGFIIKVLGQDHFCGSSVQGRTGQNRMEVRLPRTKKSSAGPVKQRKVESYWGVIWSTWEMHDGIDEIRWQEDKVIEDQRKATTLCRWVGKNEQKQDERLMKLFGVIGAMILKRQCLGIGLREPTQKWSSESSEQPCTQNRKSAIAQWSAACG